ncbi:MAG TPA: hypothetical protein VFZ65_08820 [Planctomycetota bacterium]|nr:hypothetical protein [Planctomycetota bacterium]
MLRSGDLTAWGHEAGVAVVADFVEQSPLVDAPEARYFFAACLLAS